MPASLDYAAIVFGLIYYLFLCIVFLLRAFERREELKLKYIFSLQLIPFTAIFILNLLDRQLTKAITLIPLLAFLVYDVWYRAITEKKPLHHPVKWPVELVIYVVLLYAGNIGLNWYGFLVSQSYGMILVWGFIAMLACYSFYQLRHNRKKH